MKKDKRNPNLPWEMTREELETFIAERFSRWDDVFKNGSSDPTWPDGASLNLVRNHILTAYKCLKDLDSGEEQMDMFSVGNGRAEQRPPPPEVDSKYMAGLDALIAKAREVAEAVEADENYRWLVAIGEKLTDKEKEKIYFRSNVHGREFVESCIKGECYPRLRRWGSDKCMELYGGCKEYQLDNVKELRERWSEKYANMFEDAEQRIPDLFQTMQAPQVEKPSLKETLALNKEKADAHNVKLIKPDKNINNQKESR